MKSYKPLDVHDPGRRELYHWIVNMTAMLNREFPGGQPLAIVLIGLAVRDYDHAPTDLSSLAGILGIPRNTVRSRILRLEQLGLVECEPAPGRLHIRATEKGWDVLAPLLNRQLEYCLPRACTEVRRRSQCPLEQG